MKTHNEGVKLTRLVLFGLFSIFNFQFSISATAQQPHDISGVDAVNPDSIIAIPLPPKSNRQMKKYESPELVGARQALGSQLIDGDLPHPLLDYVTKSGLVEERISMFEGGLTVVSMSGAGGNMHKKLLIPIDAVAAYRRAASPEKLALIRNEDVSKPAIERHSLLRIYRADGSHVELQFDPSGSVPKTLADEIRPLEDLLRVVAEDRTVTSTVAGYEPAVGDELVGDDQRIWRIERVTDQGVIELHCVGQPTIVYIDKHFLYNYF
ncbi:MAG TPA: hypothetical protein VF381_05455, partial [Thermoanaerobaculia bacterium]